MEVQLYGNKKQASLRIDSEFHLSIISNISRDIADIKGKTTPLVVSKLGIERLLAKLKLAYSQGLGLQESSEIEYMLIMAQVEEQQVIAVYDVKAKKEENKILEIDFFMNTVSVENQNTIVLTKPSLIICDNFSYFFEDKEKKTRRIIERFKIEELERNFEIIVECFSFVVLPRKYFTNDRITKISFEIYKIFQKIGYQVVEKTSFYQFLYRKRVNYFEGSRGIYIQPRAKLEIILLNYLERSQLD